MTLTMIGKSGSGKTSFMAGLHESMLNATTYDYKIVPHAASFHDAFKESSRYDSLSIPRMGMKFAAGTTQTSKYSFDLFYKNDKLSEIKWIDYRGGAFDELFNGVSIDSHSGAILDSISNSDGVMLFLDGIILSNERYNSSSLSFISGIKTIYRILEYMNQFSQKENVGITVCITKCDSDLIDDKYLNDNFKKLRKKAIDLLGPITKLVKLSRVFSYIGILPVGVVGMGGTSTKIIETGDFFTQDSIETTIVSYPVPINCAEALIFSVKQWFKTWISIQEKTIEVIDGELKPFIGSSGLFSGINKISNSLNSGKKKTINELQSKREEAVKKKEWYEFHYKKMSAISNPKVSVL